MRLRKYSNLLLTRPAVNVVMNKSLCNEFYITYHVLALQLFGRCDVSSYWLRRHQQNVHRVSETLGAMCEDPHLTSIMDSRRRQILLWIIQCNINCDSLTKSIFHDRLLIYNRDTFDWESIILHWRLRAIIDNGLRDKIISDYDR